MGKNADGGRAVGSCWFESNCVQIREVQAVTPRKDEVAKGVRQAVRHGNLTPAFGGSSPSRPAIRNIGAIG